MKYLLAVAIISFLSAGKCGEHKEKGVVVTEPQVNTNPLSKEEKENPAPPSKESKEEAVKDSVPVCVRNIIDSLNKQELPEGPLQVDEYIYNGRTVYLFGARCCDQYNILYDANCKPMCAPSGGFTGRGDGKCSDFADKAKHVKLIWKDPSK